MSQPHDETTTGAMQQTNLPADGGEFIRRFLPTSPYVGHLGMRLVEMRPDEATLALPFSNEVVTIGNTVHGGAIASLIDTTAMVAAWCGAPVPEQLRGTTVGLTVSYLAAATGEDLLATARVLRRGRSLVYLDVDVRNQAGRAVAKGLVTYKLG
ncbi:MAG TPA: PaaI family thioesterase [Ktedonobacterales bacterium]|nr:PaaI family thioesterase [Ktedonobacterales bacterium]